MASEASLKSPKRSVAGNHVTVGGRPSSSALSNLASGASYTVAWKRCSVCTSRNFTFKSPREFCQHLRDFHCTREGGSFVCRFGANGVCPSLPLDGVSDRDYEDHVARDHVSSVHPNQAISMSKTDPDHEGGSNADSSSNTTSAPKSSSSEPSVVTDQHKWTIYQSKVNLPAVLNDPRLARRETDFFTKTWGESFEKKSVFPNPYLEVVTRENFKKYLKKTSERFKEHQKGVQAVPITSPSEPPSSPVHIPVLSASQQEKNRTELEAIPKIFMTPGFNLENPDTFSAVFPWSQVEGGKQGGKRHSAKLLQEKLSHYLDVVEVQIAKQISLRSEAFFHAMSSHDALQEQMKNTCSSITILRGNMKNMDEVLAKGPLQVMKLAKRRDNYISIKNKLKLMSTVHQTQPTIQLLLSTNEFVGALDLISTTQEVLSQELQGIVCFRHLGSQLLELEKLIDKMMQEDFVKYANQDLNRPLDDSNPVMEQPLGLTIAQEKLISIVLGMLRQNKLHFIDVYKEEAATALKAVVKQTVIEAVSKSDSVDTEDSHSLADQMRLLHYKEWMALLQQVFSNLLIVLNRVKGMVSVIEDMLHLSMAPPTPSPVSPTPPVFPTENHSTDPNHTSHLSPSHNNASPSHQPLISQTSDMSDVLYDMEADIEAVLRGEGVDLGEVSIQDRVLQNGQPAHLQQSQSDESPSQQVADERVMESQVNENDPSQMLTSGECVKVISLMKEMLFQVCNHAHDRCVKLLNARAKDGFLEKLSTHEFVTLSRAIEGFVSECNAICGKKSTSLRTCLQSQANRFVTRFHEERRNKLSLILDNERWKQNDVPTEFQELVNHISSSGQLSLPKRKLDFEAKPGDYLFVNEEKYAVVGTVLLLLKMVVEYCQCVDDIPTATPDILSRLVELLKMFNSRTCQLILGAGAVQLVGLRTISTKNLALASRCLQLVVVYIPLVKQHFTDRLQPKQHSMLKYFDQVNKDYADHVSELSNKLVAIMDSMFEMSLSKWEVKAPMPSACFRNICKQIAKLHEAIVEILPQSQVLALFQRVHNSFKIFLRGQLIKLGVCNDGSPQHGLVVSDVAFYTGSIKSLAGLQHLKDNMDDIWDKT